MSKKNKRVVATIEFNSPLSAKLIKEALKRFGVWGEDAIEYKPKQIQVNLIKDDQVSPPVALGSK